MQPVVSVQYQYGKETEQAGFLPLEVKTQSKYLRVKGTMTLPAIHGSLFVLRPDDCIETMMVNGKALPADDVKFCNARPGKRINLSGTLFPGKNSIEWNIRDTGGTGGMAMPLSWLDPVFLALVSSLVLLIVLFGSRLLSLLTPQSKSAHALFFITVAAIVVRLALSWHPGYGYDIKLNKQWAQHAVEQGIGHSYQINPSKGSRPNYPPLNLIVLAGAHYLYTSIAPLPPSEKWSVGYHVAMKLPAIAADGLICILLFFVCSSLFTPKKGLIAAAIYAFHPAAIFLSAAWGQTDAIYALAMTAALLMAIQKRWVLTGVCLGASLLLKVQSIILLPLVILFLFEEGAWWRMISGALVVFLVTLFPFVYSHTLSDVLQSYLSSVGFYHSLTMSADNVWVILFGSAVSKSSLDTMLGLNFRTIGVCVFAAAAAFLLAISYRTIAHWQRRKEYGIALFLLSSLIAFSFFLFNAEMHERYLFPFIVFGIPFVFTGKRGAMLYLFASTLFFGNLSHVLQLGQFDRSVWKAFPGFKSFIASGLFFVFVMMVYHYWAWLKERKTLGKQ